MDATKQLLFSMADDALILGHRNSEWTGLGPILEEDIAFSSMAQDKIGHALALYSILHTEFGEADPDTLGFSRDELSFKCCHLVEYPIGEYDFSLVRHFFYDHAEYFRYKLLENSSLESLRNLARKVSGELRYHVLHADTYIKRLGQANEESKARMQSAINEVYPLALGYFEELEGEDSLKAQGVFEGYAAVKNKWIESVTKVLTEAGLKLPDGDVEVANGGRKGYHTEYLKPLLEEMTEVYTIDPAAEW